MKSAEDGALKAQAAASTALTLARDARQESASFERDIVSAKEQAAKAESHLAEALKQATAATVELQRLKSPRSLIDVPMLVLKLKAFSGTEYRLRVFADDESIQLAKIVDDVLRRAGWTRKPTPYRLGITSISIFGKDREQAVPTCFNTGVQIRVRSKESLDVLNARAWKDQTPTVQAAVILLSIFRSAIAPPNENNVEDKPMLDDEPGEDPMQISIGKKP